jgi:hypothetical protein
MAARTTATKPAPAAEVEEYDFDSWTEDNEAAAIAALAPNTRYIIVEKNFIGRFEDGVTVKLPLSITLDDVEMMSAENPDPVDQVKALLKGMGGDDAVKEFTRHNLAETIQLSEKFFAVFTRISQATIPES